MVFGKIKNAIHDKIEDVKEDRARTKEIKRRVQKDEKEIYYRQLEKEMKAKSYERISRKAEHNAQPKLQRIAATGRSVANRMPTLNTNGPDPFGLFSSQQPTRQTKRRSGNRTIVIVGGQPAQRRKKRQAPGNNGFNRDDYLNNLM